MSLTDRTGLSEEQEKKNREEFQSARDAEERARQARLEAIERYRTSLVDPTDDLAIATTMRHLADRLEEACRYNVTLTQQHIALLEKSTNFDLPLALATVRAQELRIATLEGQLVDQREFRQELLKKLTTADARAAAAEERATKAEKRAAGVMSLKAKKRG